MSKKVFYFHHHIAIATLVTLALTSIYQSYYPLPEASANTVTIVVDTENTISLAEVPCGSPAAENEDCGIGQIMYYLDFYLQAPANAINKQFKVTMGSNVHRINLDRSITWAFPRACTNCSLEIDGLDSNGQKIPIISSTSSEMPTKPATGFIINENNIPITIKNFAFQGFSDTAVKIENITNAIATVSDNAFGNIDSNTQTSTRGLTVTNASNTVINNNIFAGHTGDAMHLTGVNTSNLRIANNSFGVRSRTNLASALAENQRNALLISNNAHDITIDNTNTFANSRNNGIRLDSTRNITIAGGTLFFNNQEQAISLVNGANNNVAANTITSAEKQGSTLIVKGSGTSGALVNFYQANNSSNPSVTADTNGGEGFFFLGSATIDSSSDTNPTSGQFTFTLFNDIPVGTTISSFQTSNNNSSIFSNNILVRDFTSPAPTSNNLPIANAGPDQTVTTNTTVTLHGENSNDADGDTLSFQWTQSNSDTNQVNLSGSTTANPTFIAPTITTLETDLHFSLEINDGKGGISTDNVTIHVTRSRQAPRAVLQVQPNNRIAPGTEIVLDASESIFDSATTLKNYTFRQIPSGEIRVTINQNSRTNPQATVLIPGGLTIATNLTFELVVDDSANTSEPARATVQVVPQATSNQLCTDQTPVANAGKNQTISKPAGTIVILDGQKSTDPNNTGLTYSWRQMAGGPRVDIRNITGPVANFSTPQLSTLENTLNFALTITNRCGQSDTANMRITIKNIDFDNDTISNEQEISIGTNPREQDSDSDGLNDNIEIQAHCLNPLSNDSDNDGLKDGEEDINHNGITDGGETNPCLDDTDGDSLYDGFEKNNGLNPINPHDANSDLDNDGLTAKEELVYKTDHRNADTDADGLPDGIEIKGTNRTFPTDDDTDNDGILDGNEDINHNGSTETNETYSTRFDSDFDGLSDGLEIGLGSPQGKNTDLKKFQPDIYPISKTSPLSADSDGDRLFDGAEDTNHNGSFDCGETDPLNSQNIIKSCALITSTPTIIKSPRSIGSSIQVQKPIASPTSSGLVQLVSPLNNFSISVQKGPTSGSSFSLPNNAGTSILVLPALLSNPATAISSIFVFGQLE